MTDTDMPWSAPSAPPSESSSGSSSGSSSAPISSKAPLSGAARAAAQSTFNLPPTAFELMCRELEEREKAAGQQQEQSAAPGVPAWLLAPKPMEPVPELTKGPDIGEMNHFLDELYAVRAQEKGWLAHLEGEKAVIAGENKKAFGEQRADQAAAAQAAGQSAAGGAQITAGWGQHHAEEQRGWAEYDRTETAGERQHETEERSRSGGMSL